MRYFKKRRDRRRENITANEALNRLLKSLKFDPASMAVFETWDKESQSYVRQCEAVALQGTRLCVRVPTAAHRQDLYYAKNRLITRINQAMGKKAVTDIQFEF